MFCLNNSFPILCDGQDVFIFAIIMFLQRLFVILQQVRQLPVGNGKRKGETDGSLFIFHL